MRPPLEYSDLSVLHAVVARMRADATSGVDAPSLRQTLLQRWALATGCAKDGEFKYYARLLERSEEALRRARTLSRL